MLGGIHGQERTAQSCDQENELCRNQGQPLVAVKQETRTLLCGEGRKRGSENSS